MLKTFGYQKKEANELKDIQSRDKLMLLQQIFQKYLIMLGE
jgi:hypothetical protein